MQKRRDLLPFLFLGIISIICLLITFFLVDPEKKLDFIIISISPIPIFFLFIFLFIFSLTVFVIKNIARGILLGIFITGLFFLKFLGFLNIFYAIILLLIIVILDIGLKKR